MKTVKISQSLWRVMYDYMTSIRNGGFVARKACVCVCVSVYTLTVLAHQLVELVQCLWMFRWVAHWVLLWTGLALLGMWGRSLAAVAAHKRWQNGGVVHPPVQPPQQSPHALRRHGRVPAIASVPFWASPPDGQRAHLQLLPASAARISVHVLGGHGDGVLPPIAEPAVLVVLQQVVDGPQPQCVTRA